MTDFETDATKLVELERPLPKCLSRREKLEQFFVRRNKIALQKEAQSLTERIGDPITQEELIHNVGELDLEKV